MASLYLPKWTQLHDDSGNPLNGGKLSFTITTTTTNKATYPTRADALAGTNANTNPVVLAADGRPEVEIWIVGQYRLRTYTSADVLIADDDVIEDVVAASDFQSGAPTYGGTNSGTANALVFSFTPAVTAAVNGRVMSGRITADNSTAVTVSYGAGVKSLVKQDGGALISGDLQGPDVIEWVEDTITDVCRLKTPTYNKLARLDTNQSFTKAQGVDRTALTDAATVAVDASLSNFYTLLLTAAVGGTRALGQPTNPKDGQSLTIVITQSSGGSNALTYHADWLFPGGVDPTLSTGANAVDVLSAVYNGGTTKWYAVLNKAFA